MPEQDDAGERLRRAFLRQAPHFDLRTSLPTRVSALIRRRRRQRLIVTVAALVAIIAAVAIPLASLRSSPAPKPTNPATGSTSTSTLPGGPSLVAHWTPLAASSGGLPAGAQIASVVQFQGRYVAAGSYFPGRGPSALPNCSTDGCNPVVWTSPNGRQWTATWESVAGGSIPGETLVVAPAGLLLFLGDEATELWRSSDAVTWEKVPLPAAMTGLVVEGAVWGDGSFVAIFNNKFAGAPDTAYGESDTVWTSPDGVTWHQGVLGETAVLTAVTPTPTGFLIGGYTHTRLPTVWTSTDGSRWSATTLSRSPGSVTSVASDGTAMVVGNLLGGFWWSTNAGKWTEGKLPEVTPDVVATPAGFVAGGATGTVGLWTSSTGAVWREVINQGAPNAPPGSLDGLFPDHTGALAVVTARSPVASVGLQVQIWKLNFTGVSATPSPSA